MDIHKTKNRMGMGARLKLVLLCIPILPALAAVCCLAAGAGYAAAVSAASTVAAVSAFAAYRFIMAGLGRPLSKVMAAVKSFIAADYRLDSAVPKEGWPEAGQLISALNRLMLELSAYRAFHLNQVVEERAKAQALIETIPDGVMLIDDKGRLIYSNQKAMEILGVRKPEQGLPLPDQVSQEGMAGALRAIMDSPDNFVKAEVAVGDGNKERAITQSYRLLSRQFSIATLKRPGRVVIMRDVTMEKEIENARETFFHMITHDMRAPLASIQGYAELISKTVPSRSDAFEKYLQAILRSSGRLKGMIEDILNTIRLERGEWKLNLSGVDAGVMCAGVSEVYQPLAERKNIKFSVAAPAEKVVFCADATLLERVVANLVGNALKFTPSGGEVSVSCRAEPGGVVFRVDDTGPGVPEAKREEIFEKYAQMEEHKYMGFGLGLAMCKMAVELHKGRIWVESVSGKGSSFLFAVPYTEVRAGKEAV